MGGPCTWHGCEGLSRPGTFAALHGSPRHDRAAAASFSTFRTLPAAPPEGAGLAACGSPAPGAARGGGEPLNRKTPTTSPSKRQGRRGFARPIRADLVLHAETASKRTRSLLAFQQLVSPVISFYFASLRPISGQCRHEGRFPRRFLAAQTPENRRFWCNAPPEPPNHPNCQRSLESAARTRV